MSRVNLTQESGAGKRLLDKNTVTYPGEGHPLPFLRRGWHGDRNAGLVNYFRSREVGTRIGCELYVPVLSSCIHTIARLALRNNFWQRL